MRNDSRWRHAVTIREKVYSHPSLSDETFINKLCYFISKSFVLFSHKIVRQNYLVYIFGATIVNMSSIMHG